MWYLPGDKTLGLDFIRSMSASTMQRAISCSSSLLRNLCREPGKEQTDCNRVVHQVMTECC